MFDKFISEIIKGIFLGFLYLQITLANDTTVENIKENNDSKNISQTKPIRSGFLGKMGELVRKAIDCCIE